MDISSAKELLEKTREDYNLIAKDFSRTREKPWPEIKFLFDNYLSSGDKVLDLGCGNGRLIELFQDKEIEYFGVDNSEELIKIAKEKYPDKNFQTADALNLPFSGNFFDKVFSIAVLHQIPSKELRLQFLKEVKRVLKPGGQLILTVWVFHQPKELFLIFKATLLKILSLSRLDFGDFFEPWGKKLQRYYHDFSKRELFNLAKEIGFRVKDVGVVRNKRGNRRNIYLILQKP